MARGFSEGLAPVGNSKGLWAYINTKGKVVLPFVYNFADLFTDGKARVMKNGEFMIIDKEGKKVKEEQ